MSTSTDGIIFYGYIWDDETELFATDENDGDTSDVEWPEVIARQRGIINPWDDYPHEEEAPLKGYKERQAFLDAWAARHHQEIDTWHTAQRDIEKEFNVSLGYHGSSEWRVPYVAIKSSEVFAARGYPKKITEEIFIDTPEWDTQLDAFLDLLGIEPPESSGLTQVPGWWLASWWG